MTTIETKMVFDGKNKEEIKEKTKCKEWLGKNWMLFLLGFGRAKLE